MRPNPHPSGELKEGLVRRRGWRGERNNGMMLEVSRDLEYVLGEGLFERAVLYPVSRNRGEL